jgi:hypothetical protein
LSAVCRGCADRQYSDSAGTDYTDEFGLDLVLDGLDRALGRS